MTNEAGMSFKINRYIAMLPLLPFHGKEGLDFESPELSRRVLALTVAYRACPRRLMPPPRLQNKARMCLGINRFNKSTPKSRLLESEDLGIDVGEAKDVGLKLQIANHKSFFGAVL